MTGQVARGMSLIEVPDVTKATHLERKCDETHTLLRFATARAAEFGWVAISAASLSSQWTPVRPYTTLPSSREPADAGNMKIVKQSPRR